MKSSITSSDFVWFVCLCCGAMIGASTRYFISTLAAYGNREYFSSEYALIIGCLVLGIVNSAKKKLHPFVVMAIGTGFCGCCTTFSTWQAESCALVLRGPPNLSAVVLSSKTSQVLHWLQVVFTGLFVSIGSYGCGIVCGNLFSYQEKLEEGIAVEEEAPCEGVVEESSLSPIDNNGDYHEMREEEENSASVGVAHSRKNKGNSRLLLPALVLFLFVVVLVVLVAVLPYGAPHAEVLWTALFATPGALIRHLLCSRIPQKKNIGLVWNGTTVANICGCTLLAILVLVENEMNLGVDSVVSGGTVFSGLMSGFCGSLTTVSTFVSDAHKLSSQSSGRALRYLVGSVLIGQVIMFYSWSVYTSDRQPLLRTVMIKEKGVAASQQCLLHPHLLYLFLGCFQVIAI
eukprot:m.106191 g.106191  ORF g.106191 m.106191 type:complete len:402 (-) comp12670_c0_seq4:1315-2520(-)